MVVQAKPQYTLTNHSTSAKNNNSHWITLTCLWNEKIQTLCVSELYQRLMIYQVTLAIKGERQRVVSQFEYPKNETG